MRPYFEKMDVFGKALQLNLSKDGVENTRQILRVETAFEKEKEKVKQVGFPTEKINARGQMTVWQRIEYLVDSGTRPGSLATGVWAFIRQRRNGIGV